MTFEPYLSKLIEYTEDRRLVLSRQSEAWSCFCQASSVEYCGDFLLALGLPSKPETKWPNF